VILELCKGVHCVDLDESFQTHIYVQNLASIQPRTSPVKFARPLAIVARLSPRCSAAGCHGIGQGDRAYAQLLVAKTMRSRRAAAGRAELLANFFGGAVWGNFRENANCGDPPG